MKCKYAELGYEYNQLVVNKNNVQERLLEGVTQQFEIIEKYKVLLEIFNKWSKKYFYYENKEQGQRKKKYACKK